MRQLIRTLYIKSFFAFQKSAKWRPVRHRGRMFIDPADYHDRLFMSARFEQDLDLLFRNYLQRGDGVLDCGAQKGYFTLLFSQKCGTNGQVLAIEADPRSYEKLCTHLSANKCTNTTPIQVLISSKRQTVDFHLSDTIGHSSAFPSELASSYVQKIVSIESITLDEVVSSHPLAAKLSLIKLDIEGSEMEALKGAEQILQIHRPTVVFELNNPSLLSASTSAADVASFLHARNYGIYHLHFKRNALLKPSVYITPTSTLPADGCHNIVAVHNESPYMTRVSGLIR